MLDRTIPFKNIIMRCDSYQLQTVFLPCGFEIVPYQEGFEKFWATLEFEVGDFSSVEEAEAYFVDTYMHNPQQLLNRARFLLAPDGSVIGSCIAWEDVRQDSMVSSLHWLIVDERYHGMGLGKALCCEVMKIYKDSGSLPVYIHTQPWSWKAVLLYISLGFKLQKTDSFSHYTNEYLEAMSVLKSILSGKQYEILVSCSED